MNSTPRTATRGGNKKSDGGVKGQKSDGKKDGTKNSDSKKANPNSERIAKITETVTDESATKKKVETIMNLNLGISEEVAIAAIYDNDGDVNRAANFLMEGGGGEGGGWETSSRKRKSKTAVVKGEGVGGRGEDELDENDSQPLSANQDRDRSRGRGGGAPRGRGRGAGDRGPGRYRDNKENEMGTNDGPRGDRGEGFRRDSRGRGMSNGPGGRPGRGGRGGGGRLGSRPYVARDGDRRDRDSRFPSTIDTWNPSGAPDKSEPPLKMETWDDSSFPAAEDWDNEEYTGSLADTKVFTPSAVENQTGGTVADPTDNSAQDILSMTQDYQQTAAMPPSPLPVGVGTLSTAQAQYLTQLTQQSAESKAAAASAAYQSESLKSAVGISGGTYAQSASYAPANSYGQSTYPSTYGASAANYQNSTGYAATSAAVTNAFSSGTSAQGSAFSGAAGVPNAAYSAATAATGSGYASTTGQFPASMQSYQTGSNASYTGYTSAAASATYNSYTSPSVTFETANSDSNSASAQPQRVKTQRPRVPPPSKIPSSAVEMPEDQGVGMVSLQFGALEFGSDGTSLEDVVPTDSNSVGTDATTTTGLDITSPSQASLAAYSNKSVNSQQASLVGGLTGKLSNNDGLGISANDHKTSYNSQATRAPITTSGIDLAKSDVSYAAAPTATNYTGYPTQKSTGYQATSYSAAYTAAPTTYSAPSSYATSYSSQQSANTFPTSYGSQPSNASSYPASTATYPSTNSFPNASQTYQSQSSGYGSYPTGYQNSYSSSSSASAKLNSGLSTTKENEFTSNSSSNLSSSASVGAGVTSTTTSGAALSSTSAPTTTTTTSSSKISATGAIKGGSVLPSLHPQMLGTPQYIMGGTGMPFYHQTPVYGYEDVQLHPIQRIPHMPAQYYDVGYTTPTSLATAGRESLPNVAFTMADARYSGRTDNSASPVPSTLSQQTASGAHQQPMINHPSFPPGYTTYIHAYNTMPGSIAGGFQYPIFPVQSAGNAHATSSSQFAKPATYGSTYGSGYEALSQDYTKSPYVSSGVGAKSTVGVGGPTVTSSTSSADLYGKSHTALGKVNSYDKQGFHSATPPPFNLATGQATGMAASGGYPPQQVYIPAMPTHHNLIASHLTELTGNSGQRAQTAPQPGKSASKQGYTPYWSAN